MNNKYLISVVGPTGIGKTSLSIKLAEAFKTEIISGDSRQFYQEMNIGTAVPSPEELRAIPHHLIQHISIDEDYSVGDFEKEALTLTEKLFNKYRYLILVGGSGLYIKSLLEGLDEFPEINPNIRVELNELLEEKGLESLKIKLKLVDPEYFARMDQDNPHRVIRALEVSLGTGKPFSSFLNRPKIARNFKNIKIGLTAPREIIYDRINRRVDIMMEQGLLDEAKKLYSKRRYNALNTVGYKELFSFIEGKCSLEETVDEIKMNTRRFAKRQLTWFRKEKDIHWFNYDVSPEEVINFIKSKTVEN